MSNDKEVDLKTFWYIWAGAVLGCVLGTSLSTGRCEQHLKKIETALTQSK